MAGRERRSMMTGAQAAHCGSVSAISLGLPVSTAIPEAKGTLPKALFVGKAPISGKLKQRLVNEIESITMLALARSANTGLADGKLIPEVLVIGLKLTAKATGIPNEVIDLIAGQRKSGIVFVCVRDVPFEGSTREECAFAVRRAIPGRAGHTPIYQVYAGDWQPAGGASWSWPALLLMSCGHRCAHRPFWVRRRSRIWMRASFAILKLLGSNPKWTSSLVTISASRTRPSATRSMPNSTRPRRSSQNCARHSDVKAIGLPLAGAGSRSETEGGPGPWPRATPKLIEIFVHHTAYS